ncbi:MAG: N-acetyltransferase [Cyanobacteria bacterium P01_D01_bin.56]
MNIRTATSLERDNIHNVHWAAFPEEERELVSKLAVDLLLKETDPPILSLIAETEGNVVGHVAFSPVSIDSNQTIQGYILAPLAVKPDCQKHGIGSQLVKNGMQQLSTMGVDILLVYGDPKYYGRFGFNADVAESYIPPYKLEYPFGWQGVALGDSGVQQSSIQIACVNSLSDPALW